jgi:ketopantoate reductase
MQNGVENARVLQQHLPSHIVIACVVGFNVVWQDDATFHRGTTHTAHTHARARTHAAHGTQRMTRHTTRA